jgi:hypothetical protein
MDKVQLRHDRKITFPFAGMLRLSWLAQAMRVQRQAFGGANAKQEET